MKTTGYTVLLIVVILVNSLVVTGQQPQFILSFDSTNNEIIKLEGYHEFVRGVRNEALKLDGFTTSAIIIPESTPQLPDEFTIEAWIALGAYPWNKVPVLAQENKEITGFFFGVDSRGRVGMEMSDGSSVWHRCWSEIPEGKNVGIGLREWYHIAATYSRENGIRVFINGVPESGNTMPRRFTRAAENEMLVGRNNRPIAPSDPVRPWATFPSWYSFDGLIDELRVYDRSLEPAVIAAHYEQENPDALPALEARSFPNVKSSGRFGASFTTLNYYKEWDRLWPVGPHADIVVQFDDSPVKVMFWRGTRYSPCWVSENGKWMADQSRETGGNWFLRQGSADEYVTGCVEHMSDVQCRSSRVAIIENNDARVVIHWRYLQMDVKLRQIDLKDNSGFGQWSDEYYYIYPDGIAVRKLLPGHGGWQETIFLNEPGTRPEDNVEMEAITLVNMNGQSKSYSWENGFPKFDLEDPVIQMTNFRSEYKPFLIHREGTRFRVFAGEAREGYSKFPWWNHWPVAQVASDGRYCNAADRASHSSLSWGFTDKDAALYGMTDRPAEELAVVARSWNNPPEIISVKGVNDEKYDYTERIYKLSAAGNNELSFTLNASEKSPAYNPAFEVSNWNNRDFKLFVNNKETNDSKYRYGVEYDAEGNSRLILFVEGTFTGKTAFNIRPER